MVKKKLIKAMVIIFLTDLISNLILLFFFNIQITKQTIIATALFTVSLALILKIADVIKDE